MLKDDIQYSRVKASHKLMLLVFLAVFIWSAIEPYSYKTWLPLAVPTLIFGIPILLNYKKFKFSTFVYLVILIHAIIVIIGAKFTYTFNPLFDYLMRQFDLNRNYYYRLGHFVLALCATFELEEFAVAKLS